jgi:hypothetical protein
VGGGIKVHSTLRPLNGLLCQPLVIMIMEKSVECLAGETEVLGENLSQCRCVHHKSHMLPVREPGPPRWVSQWLIMNIDSVPGLLHLVDVGNGINVVEVHAA